MECTRTSGPAAGRFACLSSSIKRQVSHNYGETDLFPHACRCDETCNSRRFKVQTRCREWVVGEIWMMRRRWMWLVLSPQCEWHMYMWTSSLRPGLTSGMCPLWAFPRRLSILAGSILMIGCLGLKVNVVYKPTCARMLN